MKNRMQKITNEDRSDVQAVYNQFFKENGGWPAMDKAGGASEPGHGKFFESIVNKKNRKKHLTVESCKRLDKLLSRYGR